MNKLDKDTKILDKAIKVLDAQARNAAGILLGELVKKSGNKYVLKDKWGTEYLVSENDYQWLTESKKTTSVDIRAVGTRMN